MPRTANLRRQHDAALDLVQRILADAVELEQSGVPYKVGLLMAKLTGMLRIHFAQEDLTLYPHMIASNHPQASSTAAAFQAEMGGLGQQFEAFANRWQSGETIAANPGGFRTEAAVIFAALGQRIERENEQLYPLADDIQDWQVQRSA
jgi:hemerythrin-like domain-containing protein